MYRLVDFPIQWILRLAHNEPHQLDQSSPNLTHGAYMPLATLSITHEVPMQECCFYDRESPLAIGVICSEDDWGEARTPN